MAAGAYTVEYAGDKIDFQDPIDGEVLLRVFRKGDQLVSVDPEGGADGQVLGSMNLSAEGKSTVTIDKVSMEFENSGMLGKNYTVKGTLGNWVWESSSMLGNTMYTLTEGGNKLATFEKTANAGKLTTAKELTPTIFEAIAFTALGIVEAKGKRNDQVKDKAMGKIKGKAFGFLKGLAK